MIATVRARVNRKDFEKKSGIKAVRKGEEVLWGSKKRTSTVREHKVWETVYSCLRVNSGCRQAPVLEEIKDNRRSEREAKHTP